MSSRKSLLKHPGLLGAIPGSHAPLAFRDRLIFLILISIYSVLAQYAPLHIENLRTGNIEWFGPAAGELVAQGFWKYSKDLCYVLVAAMSFLMLGGLSHPAAKGWRTFVWGELALLAFGTIGHLGHFDPAYWLAGLRWMIILHCAVSLAVLFVIAESSDLGVDEKVARTVSIMVLILAIFTGLQAIVSGQNIFSGAGRLYGLAPNAGALGYWMAGVGLFFILRMGESRQNLLVLALALFVVNLSGSRGPMLVLLLLTSFELTCACLSGKSSRARAIGLSIWVATLLVQVPLFSQVVSISAERGPLFETQLIGQQSRSANLKAFVLSTNEQPISATLVGKGLGFGTNTGLIFNGNVMNSSVWVDPIDNTHAAFISQFGLIGYAVAIAIIVRLCLFGLKLQSSLETKIRQALFVCALVLLSFVQNVFENPLLMVLCALACASHVARSKVVSRATVARRVMG